MLVEDIRTVEQAEEAEIQAELLEELAELQLPVIMRTCPRCEDYGPERETCERCSGEGKVNAHAVTTMAEAIRVARKLTAIATRQKGRVEAWTEEVRSIQALIDAENKRAQTRAEHWEGLLTHYHRRVLETDPKQKTIPILPGVTCQARKSPDGIDYGDEDLLGMFLLNRRPDLIKPTVRKADLKKEVRFGGFDGEKALLPDVNGELVEVPGVRPKPGGVVFKVKIDVEAGA